MSYSSKVRAKIANRRAKRERAQLVYNIAQWFGIGVLTICAIGSLGMLAACYGHYLANFSSLAQ